MVLLQLQGYSGIRIFKNEKIANNYLDALMFDIFSQNCFLRKLNFQTFLPLHLLEPIFETEQEKEKRKLEI